MDRVIGEKLNLSSLTRHEIDLYAGHTHDAVLYTLFDDQQQRYGVVVVPRHDQDRPAWLTVFAHIQGEYVIIEEDSAVDSPLHEALMAGGIPRENIILAYKGEAVPG
ncbi:MAG: element excision factor XisI family protein [bacterium]|nr:element excision factor XisI family protein [bacterium]